MEKQKIYYLSCPPGVGKTRLAVHRMQAHLRESKGLIVYVAPTIDLLKEVRSFLCKGLEDSEREKIRTAVSETVERGTVSFRLTALLNGESLPGLPMQRLAPGSVILMTHRGFLSLPDTLPRKDEMTVIFDEAYKFTAEFKPIKLKNEKERKILADLIAKNSKAVRNTSFRKFKLMSWPVEAKLISHSKDGRKQFSVLSEVLESAMNSRTDLYVREGASQHHFHEITLPSRVFQGFKTSIIMSAFLEDTQMWHLLKDNPHVELKPLWVRKEYKHIKKRVLEHTARIRDRFARLCIFPLTLQSQPLSMTRLVNGVMVSSDKIDKLRTRLERLGIGSLYNLMQMADYTSILEPTESELKALHLLKKCKAKRNPFAWYMKTASEFVETLRQEGKVQGRVLVSVNERYTKELGDNYQEYLRISTMSHGLNQYRDSNTLIYIAAVHPNPMTIALYHAVIPEYDYLKDHLADSCTQAVTRLCIRDVESETIAYVLLPDMGTAELLRSKLMGRPTIATRAIEGEGMLALSHLNPNRVRETLRITPEEKKARRAIQNKAAQVRYLSDDLNKELHKLRVRKSHCLKSLRIDPDSKKFKKRLKALEPQIEKLLELRDQRKFEAKSKSRKEAK